MNKLRRFIPVQLKLAAALLCLLFALCGLFLVLGRPMPTPTLATRMTERQMLWGEAVTLAEGPAAGRAAQRPTYWREEYWLVRRWEGLYAISTVERVGPLWRQDFFYSLNLSEDRPLTGIVLEEYPLSGDTQGEEHFMVAVSSDPRIVRIEGEYCWIPEAMRENRDEAFRLYGGSFSFEQAGSGVWTGWAVMPSSIEGSYIGASRLRGYAADGSVVVQYG